ncbi:MAG: long-chain-fatty-acid--CoA ligase [Bryobacteraceae bacterium]|nr:long-chain-fatty-acid--CoA ligase [Bryobacteraceae bacterium]
MFTPLTPIRCLHRAIDIFPDSLGVVCGERRFTYGQFGERCQRLASALTRLGIQPGDRVAYLSFNNHQLLEGYFGVVQSGAIVLPLNVRLTPAELAAILNHAGARMLVFENDFAPVAEQLSASCPGIERYASLGDKAGPAQMTYEELVAGGRPERADIYKVDENAIAELFYTSGSTGVPKGVMLSHRTLYLHALAVTTLYVQIESMAYLHTIPFFHANGWGGPQALTYLGIKQVMVRRFEPATVFRLIQQHRATDMYLVPTMANALINAPDRPQYDLSSLRRIFLGGAASSPALTEKVEANLGGLCISGYGLTETAPVLTAALPRRDAAYGSEQDRYRRQAMTGWPVIGNEVRVVDSTMSDVPRDMKTIGEIVARGDHIMEGYYNEPERTTAAFRDGWFLTGDMAVWNEEGDILIVDRKKEIIVSGGENVSSLEIEKAIAAHPAVFECAVVAAPDDQWGEVPAAIVVLKPGQQLTTEALIEFLSGKLAKFKLPRRVEFRGEALPKTGTGKIRKVELKESYWAGKEKRVQG